MKISGIICASAMVLFCSGCQAQPAVERILFIGNSHTYYNDMPKLVEQMAKGKRIQCDMIVQDGYTLSEHAATPSTLAKLKTGGYTSVVLQENSLAVLFRSDSSFSNALKKLSTAIRDANAKPYLLQNWANQFADSIPLARFGEGFYYDHFRSYDEAQQMLIEKADEAGIQHGVSEIPTGRVWSEVVNKYPTMDLWLDEWGHPDKTGSIIVAGTIYSWLFQGPASWDSVFPEQKELGKDVKEIVSRITSSLRNSK